MNSLYKLAKTALFRFTPEQAHHIIMSNLDYTAWSSQARNPSGSGRSY